MALIITEEYITEKLDAYNVAIESLRMHECADDVDGMSERLRFKLADKLEREISKWLLKNIGKS